MLRLFLGEVKRTPQAQDKDDGASPRTVGSNGDSPPLPLDKNFGADLLRTARDKAFDRIFFNALCRMVDKEFGAYAEDGRNCLKVISDAEDRCCGEQWTNFEAAVMLEKLNERYQPCGVKVTCLRQKALAPGHVLKSPKIQKKIIFVFTLGHIVRDNKGNPLRVAPVQGKSSGGGIKVE